MYDTLLQICMILLLQLHLGRYSYQMYATETLLSIACVSTSIRVFVATDT
jgi:hypothetical protein